MSYTGQGCKLCPFNDKAVNVSHVKVSRQDLHHHQMLYTQNALQSSDLHHQLRQKTLSLWSALQKFGCGAPPYEPTIFSGESLIKQQDWNLQKQKARRGHDSKPTCEGRIILQNSLSGRLCIRWGASIEPLISTLTIFELRCEHYAPGHSTDHFVNFDIGRGLYDTDYLEALFVGNEEEVRRLEGEVSEGGGLQSCVMVANSCSQKVYCGTWF